jgi:hypothetical protein
MMEAARLKRARRRLRVYFFGSGIIMAFLFLILAAVLLRLIGFDQTSHVATLVFVAAVMAGGTYGIILFGALVVHIARRVMNRQPTMEIED